MPSSTLAEPQAAAGAGQRLRVGIFLEHDIVYRHFVLSRAFADLIARHEVRFVVPEKGPANKRLTVASDPEVFGAPIDELPIDQARLFQWRRLFQVNQFVWRPGEIARHNRKLTSYFVGPRASKLYSVLSLPGVFPLFRRWSLAQIARRPFAMEDWYERFKPDVLIHPSVLEGLFINDVVLLGRKKATPTVLIMNSWDNPSTKQAVVGQADWLLVWGPQTKRHAVTHMKMDPGRVLSFGAAQFEVYRAPPRIDRAEFCRRHSIDPERRIVLYAGSSKGADEFAHLVAIDAAIESGRLQNVAVVYRPHPWGHGGFKGERLLDHPWKHVRIEDSMRSYLEEVRAGKKTILLADYADTHDVLSSIDALVSPLSTIILEAALHGKPAMCFLADQQPGSSFNLQRKMTHFDEMYANPLIPKVEGDGKLVDGLHELIGQIGDEPHRKALLASMEEFVTPYDRPYPERLRAFVERVAAGGMGEMVTPRGVTASGS
jgi:hypothetical protein